MVTKIAAVVLSILSALMFAANFHGINGRYDAPQIMETMK